jgi:basic amino acid/polyamine antiporter, APA family
MINIWAKKSLHKLMSESAGTCVQQLVSIGTLLAFAIVSAGVLILRYKSPEIHRPFKTPWFPFVPIMGILTSFGVMATLPGNTWVRLLVWMLAGLVIYFLYGMRKSKLNNPIK